MYQTTLPKVCEPVGAARFMGKYSAYDWSLEVAKKLHMGNRSATPALAVAGGRQWHTKAYRKRVEFRDFAAARRPARSRRKIAYGVIRAGIRARTSVHGPPELALTNLQTRKEGRLPASLIAYPTSDKIPIRNGFFVQVRQ